MRRVRRGAATSSEKQGFSKRRATSSRNAMPRLTEQEQQEVIRFTEADKPLPDKYRFLLFQDKRERNGGRPDNKSKRRISLYF